MDTIVTPVTVITLDSTRIVHSIKADLVARYFPPVVRLVQYDQSLPVIAVSLMQNGQTYTLPSGAAANIRVHKPDATYVYNPALGCDSTRNIVYFEVTQAMAAASGDGLAIVEIVVDGDIAGTSLITLHFEENPVPEDAIESSDEWETIYELGERIIASTVTPVSTAAGMTDHDVVYLYTGTESGWNQGHMYYYNGTTWVDAGIAVTDKTLTVEGLAADAKKTGDEIADLKDGLEQLETDLTNTINNVYATDTASGAIASFPDGADGVPVKTLTVEIEPVQSGSGAPSPTNIRPISGHTQAVVTRTGANVWDEVWELGAVLNSNGQNADGYTDRIRSKNYIPVMPNTQYYVYGGTQAVMYKRFYDANKNYLGSAYSLDTSMNSAFNTPDNAYYMRFNLAPAYGTTYKTDISVNYPATVHEYNTYNGQTVTIDLDGTRYGGTLNVETGVLTVTHAFYTINGQYTVNKHGATTLDGYYIELSRNGLPRCASTQDGTVGQFNMFKIGKLSDGNGCAFVGADTIQFRKDGGGTGAEMKAWLVNNPLQVVYPLATPQTVQLTANEISTVLGQNNVWNDCGDTTIEYRADTKLYINKMLNA